MLGIMAGMDQEAWFAGFDVVPRAVLLLVSQAPDARHHGRLAPQDSVEVHRCSSWTRFSPCPLLCYVCLGPDSVLHSGVSAVAVHLGRRCCFHAVFPFIVGRPVLPSVYTAWTIAGSAVLGQVVLPRRCTTPGAVYVWAVRSVARGDTIGAVLRRGLGHYDRCRGLDSAAGSLQDRRLSYCGAEAVPRCPGETPQLFFHGGRCPCCADATGCSLPVVVPQVRLLDKSVRPVWWRLHRSGSWTR